MIKNTLLAIMLLGMAETANAADANLNILNEMNAVKGLTSFQNYDKAWLSPEASITCKTLESRIKDDVKAYLRALHFDDGTTRDSLYIRIEKDLRDIKTDCSKYLADNRYRMLISMSKSF